MANQEEEKETSQKTSEEESEEEVESEEESEEEESEESDESDYEKELERIEKEKEHNRKGYEMRKSDDDDEDDDPDVSELVDRKVKEALEGVQKNVQRANVETLLRQNTNSDAEFKLALHHYENSIRPSDSITADVENAVLLANKHRHKSVSKEVERARDSKTSRSGDTTSQGKKNVREPNLSKADKDSLSRAGFKYNPKSGLYEKKSKSGRKMTFDPKTGRRTFSE